MFRVRLADRTASGVSENLILNVGCVAFFLILLLPQPDVGYEEFAAGHASTHPPTTFLFA